MLRCHGAPKMLCFNAINHEMRCVTVSLSLPCAKSCRSLWLVQRVVCWDLNPPRVADYSFFDDFAVEVSCWGLHSLKLLLVLAFTGRRAFDEHVCSPRGGRGRSGFSAHDVHDSGIAWE